jgi:hypothetical protein
MGAKPHKQQRRGVLHKGKTMNENEIGLNYQPDWKEEYQKAVDLHCLTLDELREANIEIKKLKTMIEAQDMVLVRSAERIVDLQTHIENLEGGRE